MALFCSPEWPAFVFTSGGLRGRPGACLASGLSFSPPGSSWAPRYVSGLRPSFSRPGAFVFTSRGLRFHVQGPSWPSRCLSGLRPFVFASGAFVASSVRVGAPAFVFTSWGLRGPVLLSGVAGLRFRVGGPSWPIFILPGPGAEILHGSRAWTFAVSGGRMAGSGAAARPVCTWTPGLRGVPRSRSVVTWWTVAALSSLGGPAPGGAVGAWSGGCWHFGPGSSSGSLPLSIAVGQPSGRMSASIMCSASLAGSGDGASSWRSASAWARSASGPCAAGPRVPMVFRSW